jgi:hypothetical protein
LGLEALLLGIAFLGEKAIVLEAGKREGLAALTELENEILGSLRKNFGVRGFHLNLNREKYKAVFAIPIIGYTGLLGYLEGLDPQERNFAGDEEFLSALGVQIGLAFERSLTQEQKEAVAAVSAQRPVAPLEPGPFLFWARSFLKSENFNLFGLLFEEVGARHGSASLTTSASPLLREYYLTSSGATAEETVLSELDPHSIFGKLWGKDDVGLLSRFGVGEARFKAAGAKSALIFPMKAGGRFLGQFYLGTSALVDEDKKGAVIEKLTPVLLAVENVFSYLEIRRAVAALSLSQTEQIKKERLAAIIETAIAVSHEVNNPLTAVLGNAQLLRLRTKDLPPEAEEKLKIIEEAAIRIQEVTAALLRVTEPVSKEYTPGIKMLDIFGQPKKEPPG